jgi:hypothetical protein
MNTHIYIIKKNAPCESSNQLEIKNNYSLHKIFRIEVKTSI